MHWAFETHKNVSTVNSKQQYFSDNTVNLLGCFCFIVVEFVAKDLQLSGDLHSSSGQPITGSTRVIFGIVK